MKYEHNFGEPIAELLEITWIHFLKVIEMDKSYEAIMKGKQK